MTTDFSTDRLVCSIVSDTIEKTNLTRREVPTKMNRFILPRLLPLFSAAKPWLLIFLIINLPSLCVVNAVSFYYGANENMLDNFKNISSNKEQTNNLEELKSVYTFCNILPLLIKSGKVPYNKDSQDICDKLMTVLEPMLGKRLPVKRMRNNPRLRFNMNHRHFRSRMQ